MWKERVRNEPHHVGNPDERGNREQTYQQQENTDSQELQIMDPELERKIQCVVERTG
jgi:hypothetical protein